MDENIKLGVSKFKNYDGVSCYMISILHILQQSPHIKNILKLIKKKDGNIINEFAAIIKTSLQNDNCNIVPRAFKKQIGEKNDMWAELEQQDSQEFYIFLISAIEEECGSKVAFAPKKSIDLSCDNYMLNLLSLNYINKSESRDYSLIKEIFIGYLISTTTCSYCNYKSPCFESFITLPLSIPIDEKLESYELNHCFTNFIKDERMDKLNKIRCDLCGIKNRSIKKIQLWKAPQILVIQLKRFLINSKITTPVSYPIENFNLSEYFHPESPFKENAIYNLFGINIHLDMGRSSLNFGHYVSIVKSNHDKNWYLFDDHRKVRKISEEYLQNKNAYLLFYYKVN
jgi:ubiquitin C-terminal hydrolase